MKILVTNDVSYYSFISSSDNFQTPLVRSPGNGRMETRLILCQWRG